MALKLAARQQAGDQESVPQIGKEQLEDDLHHLSAQSSSGGLAAIEWEAVTLQKPIPVTAVL